MLLQILSIGYNIVNLSLFSVQGLRFRKSINNSNLILYYSIQFLVQFFKLELPNSILLAIESIFLISSNFLSIPYLTSFLSFNYYFTIFLISAIWLVFTILPILELSFSVQKWTKESELLEETGFKVIARYFGK
jgi:hypothetical protein